MKSSNKIERFELTETQKQIADLILSGDKAIILSGRKFGKTAIAKYVADIRKQREELNK